MKGQHYGDSGVPRDQMSRAQQQAWEHYCGSAVVTYFDGNRKGLCGIGLAGGKIAQSSVKWMRKRGWKIPAKIKHGDGRVVDIKKYHDLPDDIVLEKTVDY